MLLAGFLNLDWREVFLPSTPLLEVFLRGTVMYLILFTLLRTILKRQAGTVAISDLLVLVLIADAAQNGMAGDYRSITEGVLLAATIIFWSFALDWLGYRFPRIQRLVHPSALLLVKNGQMVHKNLRWELITEEELMSHIRQQGVDDLSQVREAYMEGDGRISVVTYQKGSGSNSSQRRGI